jgi:hypothetical protein
MHENNKHELVIIGAGPVDTGLHLWLLTLGSVLP